VIDEDNAASDDPDFELNVARFSALDCDVDFHVDASHLERVLESCKERFALQDDDETPLSDEDLMTVEIGIHPNGTYHS